MSSKNVVPISFEYFADDEHRSVAVKGSWDDWQSPTPLQQNHHDPSSWHIHINLAPGVFLFKFVVDGHWQHAPNYKRQSDGFGGYNNVIHVEELQPVHADQQTEDNLPQSDFHQQTTFDSDRAETEIENRPKHNKHPVHSHRESDTAHDESKQPQSSCHPSVSDNENTGVQTPHNTLFSDQEDQNHSEFVDALSHQISHILNASSDHTRHQTCRVVSFVYHVNARHGCVSVKGSWDQWQKQHALVPSEYGYWHTNIDLPPGRFLFKFVVDGKWTHSARYETQSDGFDGFNNVINVIESECGAVNGQLVSFVSSLTPEPEEDGKFIPEQATDESKLPGDVELETSGSFSETSSNTSPLEVEDEEQEAVEHTFFNEVIHSSEVHELVSSDLASHHDLCTPHRAETKGVEGIAVQLNNSNEQDSRNDRPDTQVPIQTLGYLIADHANSLHGDSMDRDVDHLYSVENAKVVVESHYPRTAEAAQENRGDDNALTMPAAHAEDLDLKIQRTQVAQPARAIGDSRATVDGVTETRKTDEAREHKIDEEGTEQQTELSSSFAAEEDNLENVGSRSVSTYSGKATYLEEFELGDDNAVAESEDVHTESCGSVLETKEKQVHCTSADEHECSRPLDDFDSSRVTYAEYSSSDSMRVQEESSDGDTQSDKLKQILQGKLLESASEVDLEEVLDSVNASSPRRKERGLCAMC